MAVSYELGVTTFAPSSGAAYCTLHTGATRRARIFEIGVATTTATLSPVSLGIPANTPVASASELVQPLNPADPAGTVNVDTAWSTAPTAPAHFLRRYTIPATNGSGFIWVFARPLIVPVSSWIVLWALGAAGAACNVYFSLDEE